MLGAWWDLGGVWIVGRVGVLDGAIGEGLYVCWVVLVPGIYGGEYAGGAGGVISSVRLGELACCSA